MYGKPFDIEYNTSKHNWKMENGKWKIEIGKSGIKNLESKIKRGGGN
jgi:hypothetical protein